MCSWSSKSGSCPVCGLLLYVHSKSLSVLIAGCFILLNACIRRMNLYLHQARQHQDQWVHPRLQLDVHKNSLVWKHFIYDASSQRSVFECKQCELYLHYLWPLHCRKVPIKFKAAHKIMPLNGVLWNACRRRVAKGGQRDLKREDTSRPIQSQKTIGEVLKSQYQLITRKLAIFIASSNVLNSLVENKEFQSLIQTLDYIYAWCSTESPSWTRG